MINIRKETITILQTTARRYLKNNKQIEHCETNRY